jgi:FkbM family methyltransferase
MFTRDLARQIPGARRTVRALRIACRIIRSKAAPTQADRYDRETFAVFKRVLRPNSIAIDVGANEGLLLKEICKRAPQARHHAIEPLPDLAERLRTRFPQCQIHNCAVAEASSVAEFHVANRQAYSSLENRSVEDLKSFGLPNATLHSIQVKVCTLDEVIPQHLKIALIKIDVEGSEYRTLLGARALLARCRPTVVFEAGFSSIERSRDLFRLFREAGMSVTTMKRWLNSEPDFADVDDYLVAAPKDYYWLAH